MKKKHIPPGLPLARRGDSLFFFRIAIPRGQLKALTAFRTQSVGEGGKLPTGDPP